MYSFNERKSDIRHVLREPAVGPGGVGGILEHLGGKAGESKAADAENSVPDTSEKENEDAHGVGEPLCGLGIIPIEYIARGRVTVA
jgi:hypothetical protein